ncbi:MAG: hypothetical protein M1294_02090 [Firmicutes bacterium]|jgi:hypothetical protein|nr:hypothetical protein [Bacillota bacterium]MCL5013215.1 hypothetical protein [Bacillota bacterium]
MSLILIATHPHSDICGEITHWDRTVVAKIESERALEAYTNDAQTVWRVVRQYGSYQRAFGVPFFPVWLGKHGGMGITPETSPTADFVWAAPPSKESQGNDPCGVEAEGDEEITGGLHG